MRILKRSVCLLFVLFAAQAAFCQASLLRDYVGVIHQSYHPDVVAYLEKIKARSAKNGNKNAVKAIDAYLKGAFGTGFVYVAPSGENYIITNNHVISQSYKISITFEKTDGVKTIYDRLHVIAVDEDLDIAVVAFDAGARPFKAGLAFSAKAAEEGEDVYAAGFPGLGSDAIWQFSKGMVSNASVRFKAGENETINENALGPFIQHTAQVDPGNSGGPLLVSNSGSTSGYSVVGINTLSARGRQAANYAIPASRVVSFINSALAKTSPEKERAELQNRVDLFVKDIKAPKDIYQKIAVYLSNSCAASNAEYAVSEVFDRAPVTVQTVVLHVLDYDPLYGMNYAVAWLIEDSLHSAKKSGPIAASVGEIKQNPDGSYNVVLQRPDGSAINITWINEFGIWRIEKAGNLVNGDKSHIAKKEKDIENEEKLRTNYIFMISLGYTNIPDGPDAALMASIKFRSAYSSFGSTVFVGDDFLHIDGKYCLEIPIKLKTFAITPVLGVGLGLRFITYDTKTTNGSSSSTKTSDGLGLIGSAGLMFTTSAVSGLYAIVNYQYNAMVSGDIPHYITAGLGYAF
ncbi:MAG: serine protease [Spirochaetaceae bacterium]|jgi:serine protease Do|nr:serine protease [Spirochaetaceae bacterium]